MEAKKSLGSYIQFYNEERPHQSLGYKTPNEMHGAESSGKIKYMEALA
ncbi:integrase core domain-containing protein [Candidatus Neptunichlamydia sp. REUL1]